MVLIDKHKARKAIHKHNPGGKMLRRETVLKLLGELPEVDPVHAAGGAYCRECIHGKTYRNVPGIYGLKCDLLCAGVEPDGFCKWGRRREGADG